MPLYVVDSHALLWYLSGSPQLSAAARAALDEAAGGTSEAVVPAIVIAELIVLAEKRRGAIDLAPVLTALKTRPGFRLTALTTQTVLRIQSLTALADIHDRLIVAEALELGATVITRDRTIAASGLVPVVW